MKVKNNVAFRMKFAFCNCPFRISQQDHKKGCVKGNVPFIFYIVLRNVKTSTLKHQGISEKNYLTKSLDNSVLEA